MVSCVDNPTEQRIVAKYIERVRYLARACEMVKPVVSRGHGGCLGRLSVVPKRCWRPGRDWIARIDVVVSLARQGQLCFSEGAQRARVHAMALAAKARRCRRRGLPQLQHRDPDGHPVRAA